MGINALPAQEPPPPAYGAYSIKPKRPRRTKSAIAGIRDTIIDILENDHPQTVRQIFYAATVRGVITKTESEYQKTIIRLLVDMRETGQIPFDWIADNTRWMRKPTTFAGIEACLNATSAFYRRDLWAAMPVYCEVWCEKDALAGVLMEETSTYDVPLMVARGYSSISFLHSAAMSIEAKGKPPTSITSVISILPASMLRATLRPSCAATHPKRKSISSGPQSRARRSRSGTSRHVRPK